MPKACYVFGAGSFIAIRPFRLRGLLQNRAPVHCLSRRSPRAATLAWPSAPAVAVSAVGARACCCARPVTPASGGALGHGGGISNCPTTPGVRVVPEQKLRFSVHPGRHPSFCKLRPCKTVEFRRNRLEHWNCGAFCLAQPLRTITSLRDDLCSMSAAGDGPSVPDAPLLHPMAVANDPKLTGRIFGKWLRLPLASHSFW